MHNYSECYAALGVTPDTDWKTLRTAYKRLIGRWHPDRFLSDATRKEVAEEQCKQITLAYETLKKYRLEHGVLPPLVSDAAIAEPRRPAPDPFSDHAPPSVSPERVREATTDRAPARRRHRTAIVLAVLAAAIFLFDRDFEVPPSSRTRESGGITVGSTLGEVYSIQGVPTLTQNDTWYYGKSEIHFERGKVVSWRGHPDNPLRIAPDQPIVILGDRHFDVGSSKEEVRDLQGTPLSETESVWNYGPSKVYFERDRVVRWESTTLYPLRVPR
jgi:hypothetical protein